MDDIDLIKKRGSGEDQNKAGFYVSISLLGTAVIMGMALIASATFAPNLPAQVTGLVNGEKYGDAELVLNRSDAEMIDDRLGEEKEFGWCLSTERLSENRFSVDLKKGENMSRSRDAVSFSCSVWDTGRLHTHPGIWSVPYPSEFDVEMFQDSSRRFDCIAAGHVDVVDDPVGLNCFQKSEKGIERVRVVAE